MQNNAIPHYHAFGSPHLYRRLVTVQKGDLKKAQHRNQNMVKGQERPTHREKLKKLGLFSLAKRIRGNVIAST